MIDLAFAHLKPCQQCGAHRWEQDGHLLQQDKVRCGECATVVRCDDVAYHAWMGQD